VDVFQLLGVFWRCEHVEVIVAGLPEWPFFAFHRNRELESLNCFRQDGILRLRYEKVDVFGHYDVADDVEGILFSPGFEDGFEERFGFGGEEVGVAVLATEGDEMEVAGLLAAFGFGGHGARGPGDFVGINFREYSQGRR